MNTNLLPSALLCLSLIGLSSCSQQYCNASPFCLAPNASTVPAFSLPGGTVSIHPGETVRVPVTLSLGAVPPSLPLQWKKVDPAAEASSDASLLAMVNGTVRVSAASNPFRPSDGVNGTGTELILTASTDAPPSSAVLA